MISDLPLWVTIPGSLLLVCAGLMALIGAMGLRRLNRFYSRMHSVTLGNTISMGSVVLTSILLTSFLAHRLIVHEILILVFIVLASPITAILLMQAGINRDARRPTQRPNNNTQ